MQKIKVSLTHCYGIKKLEHDFDFQEGPSIALYASNGAMKTSLARVFADIADGQKPKDALFPHRKTEFNVQDEQGQNLQERVFVIESYKEDFQSEKIATLLVNSRLKKQYEKIHADIGEASDQLLKALQNVSGLKKGLQDELVGAFESEDIGFLALTEKLASTIYDEKYPDLSYVHYSDLFNDKVVSLLSDKKTKQGISGYVDKFYELLDKSSYFRQGGFNHTNAYTVNKALKSNLFFDANHAVILSDKNNKRKEVKSEVEFKSIIEDEKRKILNDKELEKRFDELDKLITKNVEVRNFRKLLEAKPELIPLLEDWQALKRSVWLSYLFEVRNELAHLETVYLKGKKDLESIIKNAKSQSTEWANVVKLFNERFAVPFVLQICNQEDVILEDHAPSLVFRYIDGNDSLEVGRQDLLNVLSAGEKRALYLLNIIFEIEARKKNTGIHLLVIDDIADSFDYKNKYAIIEYLKDIANAETFRLLILTHNFDFYRTIQKRLNIGRQKNCFMAVRQNDNIELRQVQYLNPFSFWKNNCETNNVIVVALIPMVRNIIEYTKGLQSQDYKVLTALLHQKSETDNLLKEDFECILNNILNTNISLGSGNAVEFIFHQAETVFGLHDEIALENKVVLAIATRLAAERFMIKEINDSNLLNGISGSQTGKIFDHYKRLVNVGNSDFRNLEQVVLMTPEVIHFNSFMYEPILDMSNHHLKSVYSSIKSMAERVDVWPTI